MKRRRLVSFGSVVVMLSCACAKEPAAFTLLQANVGNILLACQENYVFKLCEADAEALIRDNIAALSPDVIALQEILPDAVCDAIDETDAETDARFSCHPENRAAEPTQIRRLLSSEYAFVCDDRNGYECVAAKEGIELGAYVVEPPVDSDDDEDCDAGFTVGNVAVAVGDGFTLVNGHPQSGFIGACRKKQLDQVFENAPARAVLSGDWNLDPFAASDDPSVTRWIEEVGDDARFHYHSGTAEKNPPHPTTENPLFTGVLDHVASDVLEGTCQTLGETEGTESLCGEACDHRALFCSLSLPPVTQ